MKTFDDLIDELDGNVTILDVMKYPELLYTKVKLVEAWETDEDGYPTDHDLNSSSEVWEWIWLLYQVSKEAYEYTYKDYARLITMNMEEA